MSQTDILNRAKKLIRQEHYQEAYDLLQEIPEDEIAQEWLAKLADLDEVNVRPRGKRKNQAKKGNAGLLKVGFAVIFALVFGWFLLNSGQIDTSPTGTLEDMIEEEFSEEVLTSEERAVKQEREIITSLLMVFGVVSVVSGFVMAANYQRQGKSTVWGFILGLLIITNIALIMGGGLFSTTRGDYKCSGCGASLSGYESTCPSCGAKIRRGWF